MIIVNFEFLVLNYFLLATEPHRITQTLKKVCEKLKVIIFKDYNLGTPWLNPSQLNKKQTGFTPDKHAPRLTGQAG